ncbi:hypothetical protein [Nocardia sp. CNY236]|uniref:hypothetical protein n=1 Tax=Nocardia sp. CNY236 TaxID=1169152 RepID=UPI0003F52EA5|nr:hypothetical protein [Nocardia sp. CNY236]
MIRFLAVVSGLLLAAVIALLQPWAGIPAVILAAGGWWFRSVAVGAVLLALGVLAAGEAGVLASAATGLAATTYMLNATSVTAPRGVVPTTLASLIAAVGFTAAAAAAALVPLRPAWAPLAAPVVIVVLYALVIEGLAARRLRGD